MLTRGAIARKVTLGALARISHRRGMATAARHAGILAASRARRINSISVAALRTCNVRVLAFSVFASA